MEGFQRPKTVEEITKIIENFAEQNEMAVEDLFSDVLTFAELAEAGDGTEEYFIEMEELVGISRAEMIQAANAYKESQESEE
jgi:hypothetical protein